MNALSLAPVPELRSSGGTVAVTGRRSFHPTATTYTGGDDMDIGDDSKAVNTAPPPPSFSGVPARQEIEMEGEDDDAFKYGYSAAGGAAVAGVGADEGDGDGDIKVVTDYTPRVAGGGGPSGPMTMIDPLSGRVIPVEEMSEHMRVQLMDPRWRIEQRRFQEKQKETGFAEGSSIADSLMQFAKKRGDIFGKKEKNKITATSSSSPHRHHSLLFSQN